MQEVAKRQRDYDDNDRAEVLALMKMGKGPSAIAEATGFPLRTVARLVARWQNVAQEQGDIELLQRDYRVALRADDKLHDALDYMDDDPSGERAYKAMIALNAIRGTAIDKILKRQDEGTGSGAILGYIIVADQRQIADSVATVADTVDVSDYTVTA